MSDYSLTATRPESVQLLQVLDFLLSEMCDQHTQCTKQARVYKVCFTGEMYFTNLSLSPSQREGNSSLYWFICDNLTM